LFYINVACTGGVYPVTGIFASQNHFLNESNKRKTPFSHAVDALGKLPDTHHYDMEWNVNLLG
jgi:hypothetical protein